MEYNWSWLSFGDYEQNIIAVNFSNVPAGSTFTYVFPAGMSYINTIPGTMIQRFQTDGIHMSFSGTWTPPDAFPFAFEATVPKGNLTSPNDPDLITADPDIDNWMVAVAEQNVNDANQDYAPGPQKIFIRVVPRIQE